MFLQISLALEGGYVSNSNCFSQIILHCNRFISTSNNFIFEVTMTAFRSTYARNVNADTIATSMMLCSASQNLQNRSDPVLRPMINGETPFHPSVVNLQGCSQSFEAFLLSMLPCKIHHLKHPSIASFSQINLLTLRLLPAKEDDKTI